MLSFLLFILFLMILESDELLGGILPSQIGGIEK